MAAVRIFHNRAADRRGDYAFQKILSVACAADAYSDITQCPRYKVTPLRDLPHAAARFGVQQVVYKDEGKRFTLRSFKALGGTYAVARTLIAKLEADFGVPVSVAELVGGAFKTAIAKATVTCASDGNHGRAVAAGAQHFGCKAVIFLHEGVSAGREQAIRDLGAEVVRTAGNYDDSVDIAATTAKSQGWFLVSDTSGVGSWDVPSQVMQGYTVIVREVLEQLRATGLELPTHVFLQAGVGGLAAAVVAYLWEYLGAAAPTFVIVEPDRADCLFQSAMAGRPTEALGGLDTVMAGLSCGRVSEVAWPILAAGVTYFVTIPDSAAVTAMRLLASGELGDSPIIAAESGAAGLAALVALQASGQGAQMGLDTSSRVLLIGTEGATDPTLYEEVTGRSAEVIGGAP